MAAQRPRRARARRWGTYIDGAEDLVQLFQDMEETAEEILENATKKAADMVLDEAKRRVPVRTGKLKDSLEIKKEKRKKKIKAVHQVRSKGVSQGGVRYAFAVENGTRLARAQPFLRPAVDENRQKIINIIKEEIENALERL